MSEHISVRLIANAGLFIQAKERRFLIDALHHDPDQPFSRASEHMMKKIIHGSEDYQDVDYIMYTHCHSDHFSPGLTRAYLENNRVETLLLPEKCTAMNKELESFMADNEIHQVRLHGGVGELITYKISGDIRIHAFRSIHQGEAYKDEPHYCIVLGLDGYNILITGDADYDFRTFQSALAGLEIQVMIINPLFYNHKSGRQIISGLTRPKEVIIYHIPFEEDDIYGFRRLTKRDMEKHQSEFLKVSSLTEENQTIHLNGDP